MGMSTRPIARVPRRSMISSGNPSPDLRLQHITAVCTQSRRLTHMPWLFSPILLFSPRGVWYHTGRVRNCSGSMLNPFRGTDSRCWSMRLPCDLNPCAMRDSYGVLHVMEVSATSSTYSTILLQVATKLLFGLLHTNIK